MLRWLGFAALALLLAVAAMLGEAHWEIRRVAPELPEPASLLAIGEDGAGPVRVRYVNTATQPRLGSGTGTYGGFLLEWNDGRAFAIDVGMTREGAVSFGRLTSLAMDAGPIEPHGSFADQLGPDAQRVAGVGFTHLHLDHTGSLPGLCEARRAPLTVFQTRDQAELGNFGTAAGRSDVEDAACAKLARLDDARGPLIAIEGFPGLFAFAIAGHTPCSTTFAARIGSTLWVFAGDVTNERARLLADEPKPLWYSLFITPEDRERLGSLRRYFAALDARSDVEVVVSHDLAAIDAAGIERYSR